MLDDFSELMLEALKEFPDWEFDWYRCVNPKCCVSNIKTGDTYDIEFCENNKIRIGESDYLFSTPKKEFNYLTLHDIVFIVLEYIKNWIDDNEPPLKEPCEK